VPDITSLEMLLRSLIVALPLLLLTVLFFLLATRRRRADAPAAHAGTPLQAAAARDLAEAGPSHAIAGAAPPQEGRPAVPREAGIAKSPVDMAHQAAAATAALIAKLEAGIAQAEEAGATVELAELYLALGRAHMADGAEGEALSALRSAAGLAALHKAPKVQALARLDLAEVAMSHGDPITACEHWQMARMAFLDAGDRVEGEKIDRRMRGQGCPTDWVLTDF
jgi:hypothetical protein